jgi:sugar phosphate isomerase/epimerase
MTPRAQLGIASTCYMTYRRFRDANEFLEHANSLGAAGVQISLPSDPARFRARAEQLGLYYEAMIGLPKEDTAAFRADLRRAKEAGALCVRAACLGGRRYETFQSLDEWKAFVATSHAALARAVPILEQEKVPLALENHKDWVLEEFLALLKKFSSPWLGVCLDTGNNISLLDDPHELVNALAPFAVSTHLKDMDYEPEPDGFLLSEVPFGEGRLDLRAMIDTIRRHRPKTRLTLEMITRNPLRVPCLAESYWTTFPERSARRLAATLRRVNERRGEPLPRFDALTPAARLNAEEENVRRCLHVARERYGL